MNFEYMLAPLPVKLLSFSELTHATSVLNFSGSRATLSYDVNSINKPTQQFFFLLQVNHM